MVIKERRKYLCWKIEKQLRSTEVRGGYSHSTKRSDSPHCSLASVILEIPLCYVWRKPSAVPYALNYTQTCSFLQCRVLVLGLATSKHHFCSGHYWTERVVKAGNQHGPNMHWLLQHQVQLLHWPNSGLWGCAVNIQSRIFGISELPKAPEAMQRQCKNMYALSSVRGGFETRISSGQGRVMPLWSSLVTSENMVVLKVLWNQEVCIQPPFPTSCSQTYLHMCMQKTRKIFRKGGRK